MPKSCARAPRYDAASKAVTQQVKQHHQLHSNAAASVTASSRLGEGGEEKKKCRLCERRYVRAARETGLVCVYAS